MDIRILLEVLDTRQNQYKYTGPMEGQVYGVQVQNGSYSYLEGMLYVQPSLTHPRPPKNTCVIAGETDLYEVLQKILLNYNRKESLLIKMQDKLTAFRSSETDMISGVMDNPCILLREDYKPLVWNGFDGEDEFLWIASIDFKAVSKKGQHLNICYQECSDEIQKIEKLKEFFHVDVNDLYAYVKLYVSLVILEQMPIYDSNDFLKWM